MEDFQASAAAEEPVAQDAQPSQVDDNAPTAAEPNQPKPEEKATDAKSKRSKSPREALKKAFAADLTETPEAKPAEKAEAKTDGKDAVEKPAEPAQDAKPSEKAPDKPEGKTGHSAAPARFSADAKAEWEKAPESIRAETHRAIREMENGLAKKDAELAPIEPFIKMAKEHGTTVDKAMGNYVNMEALLRNDPASGLRALAQNMGMTPPQMASLLMGQNPGQPDPRDQQIMQLRGEIQAIQQQFGDVAQSVQQQRENAVVQTIEQFASQNPRFDDLAPEIVRLLETGFAEGLEDAYTKAERLNPAPPAPVDPATVPPVQTRQARSLTGAPSPGSDPATARTPSKSPHEALRRAFGV